MPTGRRWGVALVALGALVLGARPAAADPPRPTDYRSTVTAVDPAAGGVEAEVVGGDAFLELRVDEGHEVLVEGYGEEPYLRFLPDGTVERNRRSEATYLNDDRQGAVELPPEADNAADPDWERVAGGGTYAWHDHRIHWMGTSRPPGVEPGEVVQEWAVALTVDGTPTEVRGELVLAEGVSPLPWLALAAAGLALVVVLGRRRPLVAAAAAAMIAAAGALVVGWGQYSVAPAGSGVNPLLVVVPLLGLVAAVAGLVLRGRPAGPTATLAAAAAVLGWGALRASVLWMPVLPTDLPYALDRAVTALALGLSAAAAGLVVWRGGLVPAGATPRAATTPADAGSGDAGAGTTPAGAGSGDAGAATGEAARADGPPR
jgi:hypothetical protein